MKTLKAAVKIIEALVASRMSSGDQPEHSEDLQTDAQQEILNLPSIVPTENSSLRPTRASAVKARERMKEWIDEGSVSDQWTNDEQ